MIYEKCYIHLNIRNLSANCVCMLFLLGWFPLPYLRALKEKDLNGKNSPFLVFYLSLMED